MSVLYVEFCMHETFIDGRQETSKKSFTDNKLYSEPGAPFSPTVTGAVETGPAIRD